MNPQESEQQTRRFIKTFDVEPTGLDPQKQQLLGIYTKATESAEPIFVKRTRSPFYQNDLSDEELKTAAESNSLIFNPYTEVVKDGEKIEAPHFGLTHANELKPLIEYINTALLTETDLEQRSYLEKTLQAFNDGDFVNPLVKYLTMEKEPLIGFTFIFAETGMDNRFGVKYAPMAWVGILDENLTQSSQKIADDYLKASEWNGKRTRIRVDKTSMLSGFITTPPLIPSATSLPNQRELRNEIGTKIVVFETAFDELLKIRLPILRSITDKATDYTDEELRNASYKLLVAHEALHAIRFDGDQERLGKDYFTYMNEVSRDILAQNLSSELIGETISEKELGIAFESMVSTAITLRKLGMPDKNPYMRGWATALSFMIENGGIRIENGKIVQDAREKTAEGISQLADRMVAILQNGTSENAKEIEDKYGPVSIFDQFNLQ